MSTSSFRLVYAFLLLPIVVGGAQGGCKCKKVVPETETVVETVKAEDPLKVVSIEPSMGKPNFGQSGTVFGSGFKEGAKIVINEKDCAAVVRDSNTVKITIPAMKAGEYDVTAINPDGTSSVLRRGYIVKASIDDCRSFAVSFDYDKDALRKDANAALAAKVDCLKNAGSINVAGNADERGTTEYNLAFGQRRAETVKGYLTNSGISASKVKTVSYGEERPASSGHDESAWAQNRRADVAASE